ncbi:MAG: VanZ family protein [Planctomycetota bacterium]
MERDDGARPQERFSWPFLALAIAWMLLLHELLLSEPGRLPLPRAPSFLWNLGHVALYAPLGALLYLGLPKTHAFVLLAVAVAGAHGAVMELLQGTVQGRSSDPVDAVTNVFGAALGVALLAWLSALGRRKASPVPVLVLLGLAMASAAVASL